MKLPPFELFLSEDWIGGSFASRVAHEGMSAVVSASAGDLMQFAELAQQGAEMVTGALERLQEFGDGIISTLTSGNGANIAGWAAQAIQLFYKGLVGAFEKGAKEAKAGALRSQWDVGAYLVLRRTAFARDIPGGANFSYVQPGWKKDWPAAAVPPVPRRHYTYIHEENLHHAYRRVVLFEQATPDNVDFEVGCFSLGQGGCDVPPGAVVGLSFVSWPILVDDFSIPWGGGQLLPYTVALTTPTVLHVQVKQAMVDALRTRIRSVMRDYWNVRYGPPLAPDAVTIWPDGTYAAPSGDQTKYAAENTALIKPYNDAWLAQRKPGETIEELRERIGPFVQPRVRLRGAGPFWATTPLNYPRHGEDEEGALISPAWSDLASVSAAVRTLIRWQQCRRACLQNFSKLPADVRAFAKKNPDFSDKEIHRWGGPDGKAPPQRSNRPGDFSA